MGLKRKASTFDEPVHIYHGHPHTSPLTQSVISSPSTSTGTLSPTNGAPSYPSWNVTAVPYLISRTRKRYRDDRPGEEIIHENTLKKLYDAQRLHLDEALPMSEVDNFEEQDDLGRQDAEMMDEPVPELPQSARGSQRTIEAFFGGGTSTTGQAHPPRLHGAHPHTFPTKHSQKEHYDCSDEMFDIPRISLTTGQQRTDCHSRLGWT